MKKRVIVAGHICLDITPVFKGQVKAAEEILLPGRLVQMDRADIHTGGAVANTGLAMKKFGADVLLMGKVGTDEFGKIVQNILQGYGAADGLIVSDEVSTSYSIVLAMEGLDRIFLHNSGANDTFLAADIADTVLSGAALLHFGYPPLMQSMYKNDGKELIKLLKKVKEADVATSLDLAAMDERSDAGRMDWEKILAGILPYVDFFEPSAEELCFMIDKKRYSEWKSKARGRDITEILSMEEDIKPLAEKCMEYGCKVVLIKCGAQGMYYRTGGKKLLERMASGVQLDLDSWADKEGFEKSYIAEKVLSGTGAGDTSIAAFLAALLTGRSLEGCLKLSAAAGASCVAAYDSLSGLESLEALEAKIQAGWEKNTPAKR